MFLTTDERGWTRMAEAPMTKLQCPTRTPEGGTPYFADDRLGATAYGCASMRVKLYCETWKDRGSQIIEVKLFPHVGEIFQLGRRQRVEVLEVKRTENERRFDAIAHVKEID